MIILVAIVLPFVALLFLKYLATGLLNDVFDVINWLRIVSFPEWQPFLRKVFQQQTLSLYGTEIIEELLP